MGDEKAWAYFVEEFSSLIRWAIKDKILRSFHFVDENDVNDIFQQAFTHIWSNNRLSSLKNPRSIPAYLTIIAQNSTIDFFRKKRRFTHFSSDGAEEENLYAGGENPRAESHNRQMQEEVEDFINKLSLKEQRIITLDIFYDLKHREISKIMEIPINTVSTIIARIKQLLKDKLKERGYDV